MEDFKTWYKQQPVITRSYLTGILITTLLHKFQALSFSQLLFNPDKIWDFQLWRLVTDYFVVGQFSFNLIFVLFIIYFAFSKTELLFAGNQFPDFIYLLCFLVIFIDILAWIFSQAVLHRCLSFALIYIWCKRKPFETVTFYFGIKVQSAYFPWVLMGFHFLTGDDITNDLFGLAAGHIYIVLKDFLPMTHNKRFLETPKFFSSFVNRYLMQFTPYGQYRQQQQVFQQPQAPPRFFQGRGVNIG